MLLQGQIEALLRFNAAAFEARQLRRRRTDLLALLHEQVETQRLQWQARGLTVEVRGEPLALPVDADKLGTAVANLLSNAIRFSPAQGSIVLTVLPLPGRVCIDIADQGPGVAERDRERIFEPFYRGEHQPEGAVRGTGIGLSIVQEYIAAHGGRVTLLGDGSGAHFRIELPMLPDPSSCLRRAAALLGLAVLTACAAPAPPPVVIAVPVRAPAPAPAEAATAAAAPAADPGLASLSGVLAYADRVRGLPGPELAQEIVRLGDGSAAPERQMQLALALMQTRVPADAQRAQSLLQRVVAQETPEARALHPLARLLSAQWSEQRRVEEQLERQAQQLRDGKRRIDQLNDRLQALRAMERSLPSRPTP